MSKPTANQPLARQARLKWVPIAEMRVSPHAQRELNQNRVNKILANLDLEQIGTPTVNWRDGYWWIIDGQHRVVALREFGFADDKLQCWTYEGLSEQEEAKKFRQLNDQLRVDAMAEFKVGVTAGFDEECDINRIVLAQDLRVTREKVDGGIAAVGTLRRVYRMHGGPTLGRSLRIIRDGFGDAGLEAPVIDSMGRVCGRYNGSLSDDELVEKFQRMAGGVSGLLNKAEMTRRATGASRSEAVAATIVEVANRGRRGAAKLNDWWAT